LRETIATAIQVNLSMVTIEEGETTKRLAAWAGIFAVATAFVGIWGMNFEHMPELKWEYGYPLAVGVIVAVCAVMYWRFRKSGCLGRRLRDGARLRRAPAAVQAVRRFRGLALAQRGVDEGIGHPERDTLHVAVGQAPDVLEDHIRLDAVDDRQRVVQ